MHFASFPEAARGWAVVVERVTWPGAEQLAENEQQLIRTLAAELHDYEARYQIPSEDLADALDDGRLHETAEIADWLISLDAYQALTRERSAPVD